MPLLSSEKLQAQKGIFKHVFVNELLAEIRFLHNVSADRATAREGFKAQCLQRVMHSVSKPMGLAGTVTGTWFTPLGAGLSGAAMLLDAGEQIGQAVLAKKATQRVTRLSDLFYAPSEDYLETVFERVAEEVALSFDYLIGVKLSEEPSEGVIPLARFTARRIINHLQHLAKKDPGALAEALSETSEQPVDVFFRGMLEGHSGKRVDGFTNHPIKARAPSKEHLTVEGALERNAMRVILGRFRNTVPDLDDHPIYYSKQTHLDTVKGNQVPKYGYLWSTEGLRQHYGYDKTVSEDVLSADAFKEYPSVEIVGKKEVLKYNQYVNTKKNPKSFFRYVSETLFPKGRIDAVWVRGDFSPAKGTPVVLKGGDYSDIDFTSCDFTDATLKNVTLTRAKWVFVEASGVCFDEVNVEETDFRYATLRDAQFVNVKERNAVWVGADLTKVSDETNDKALAKRLHAQQTQQTTHLKKIRNAVRANRTKLKTLENEQLKRHHALTQQLDKVSQEQREKLTSLSERIAQNTLHLQEYRLYCLDALEGMKETTQSMTIALETLEEQVRLNEDALNHLQEQVETLAHDKGAMQQTIEDMSNTLKQRQEKTLEVSARLFRDGTKIGGIFTRKGGNYAYVTNIDPDELTQLGFNNSEKQAYIDKMWQGVQNIAKEKSTIRIDAGVGQLHVEKGGKVELEGDNEAALMMLRSRSNVPSTEKEDSTEVKKSSSP